VGGVDESERHLRSGLGGQLRRVHGCDLELALQCLRKRRPPGLVERGELDLTFSDMPLVEGPFESVELMRDPYVLVVPADSPLAQPDSPPTLREIAGS
jgi:DNA-binding transcriptional LysR family regulator